MLINLRGEYAKRRKQMIKHMCLESHRLDKSMKRNEVHQLQDDPQKSFKEQRNWKGPNWLFDLDYLTDSMNYHPVTVENKANKTVGLKEANHSAGTQDYIDAGNSKMEAETAQEYFRNDAAGAFRKEFAQCTEDLLLQEGVARATSTNTVNTVSTPISTASPSNVFSAGGPDLNNNDQDDSEIPALRYYMTI
ncbi:hypothetical protein Tco_0158972 [Tanacetum coccineum]